MAKFCVKPYQVPEPDVSTEEWRDDLFIDKIEANEYLDKHIKGVVLNDTN